MSKDRTYYSGKRKNNQKSIAIYERWRVPKEGIDPLRQKERELEQNLNVYFANSKNSLRDCGDLRIITFHPKCE